MRAGGGGRPGGALRRWRRACRGALHLPVRTAVIRCRL